MKAGVTFPNVVVDAKQSNAISSHEILSLFSYCYWYRSLPLLQFDWMRDAQSMENINQQRHQSSVDWQSISPHPEHRAPSSLCSTEVATTAVVINNQQQHKNCWNCFLFDVIQTCKYFCLAFLFFFFVLWASIGKSMGLVSGDFIGFWWNH